MLPLQMSSYTFYESYVKATAVGERTGAVRGKSSVTKTTKPHHMKYTQIVFIRLLPSHMMNP